MLLANRREGGPLGAKHHEVVEPASRKRRPRTRRKLPPQTPLTVHLGSKSTGGCPFNPMKFTEAALLVMLALATATTCINSSASLSKPNGTSGELEQNKTEAPPARNSTWLANNVLCNSRARCLLLEFSTANSTSGPSRPAEQQNKTTDEQHNKTSSLSPPLSSPLSSSSAPSSSRNASESLMEFTADYELDDEPDQRELGEPAGATDADSPQPTSGTGQQQQAAATQMAAPDHSTAAGSEQSSRPATFVASTTMTTTTTTAGAHNEAADQSSGRRQPDLTATNPSQAKTATTSTGAAAGGQQDGAGAGSGHSARAEQVADDRPTTGNAAATTGRPLDHQDPSSFSNNNHHQIMGHLFALPNGHQAPDQQQQQQQQQFRPSSRFAPPGKSAAQAASSSDQYHQTATGPQLYAQSLYSNSAPKLSFHAHSPHYISSGGGGGGGGGLGGDSSLDGQQQQLESALVTPSGGGPNRKQKSPLGGHHHHGRQLRALAPLKTLSLSNGSLFEAPQAQQQAEPQVVAPRVARMLERIASEGIQSLDLSSNQLQFELFTEIYSLLIMPMRFHLFHLNLSHNSLIKLGVTFTGYIEHNLILAAHHNNNTIRWPFAQTSRNTTSTTNNSTPSNSLNSTQQNELTLSGLSHAKLKSSRNNANGNFRHPKLGDGRLFNLVNLATSSANSDNNNRSSLIHLNASLIATHQFALIRGLDLSYNKLKWLINDQFRTLKYVQSIRLDHNRLRYIHQQAFNGLESLKYLNLNHNRIQTIYVEQFQTNYNLLALMLSANYLAYLRAGSFAALINLRRLDLSQNKFTISSNNAFVGLESLRLLNFSSNQFIHAPSAALHPLVGLEKLDLSSNQIAQLTPGAFFHLPIEELWLNDNDQLVAIDRGAFWDLPYLRRLHLRSNQVLISINSQAFVGTQNLQLIDVEGCQSLDASARQMLENITMATTSRQLRQQQQQQQQQQVSHPVKTNSTANGTQASVQATSNGLTAASQLNEQQQQINKLSAKGKTTNLRHYAYSVGLLTLLVVALKLMFKYTSTSYYLEARRRAKRVYEAKPDDDLPGDELSDAVQMELRTCEHLHRTGNGRSYLDDESCSIVSNSESSDQAATSNPFYVIPNSNQASSCSSSSSSSLDADIDSPQNKQVSLNGDKESTGKPDHDDDEFVEINLDEEEQKVIQEEGGCVDTTTTTTTSAATSLCCPECPQRTTTTIDNNEQEGSANCCDSIVVTSTTTAAAGDLQPQEDTDQQQQTNREQQQVNSNGTAALDLIHSQLVAAGFDYGHANCLHFYQSLGPALQFADLTANFVNQMDYY